MIVQSKCPHNALAYFHNLKMRDDVIANTLLICWVNIVVMLLFVQSTNSLAADHTLQLLKDSARSEALHQRPEIKPAAKKNASKPAQKNSTKKLIEAALGNYLQAQLKLKGLEPGAAVYMRIFKKTSELEMWLKDGMGDGRYRLFNTYKICKWSGKIGPKIFEGDRQSPEGFYAFSPWQLRSESRNFRAIDIGFPNDLDAVLGRTGSDIQIHGGCGSAGCFAMTDESVDEIFRLTAAAFGGGQNEIMVHAFPFRMTTKSMVEQQSHHWIKFWQNLKPVFDAFEADRVPPPIEICGKKYRMTLAPKQQGANAVDPKAPTCTTLKAPTVTIAARRRALARAAKPKPRIKIRCNLKLPPCRQWVFLQKRRLRQKDTAKRRSMRHRAKRSR